MKAVIVGAGAIGGWMAGLLAEAGWQVSLLARGATLASLNAHGLRIRRDGRQSIYRLPASDNPADLAAPDYVVIAVKGQSVPQIAPAVAALCGPQTAIVPALNGIPWWFFQSPGIPLAGTILKSVDPDGVLARGMPVACVIGCVVHASAWMPEPGLVEVNKADRLIFGEPDGSKSARCAALCAGFVGGVETVESTQIRDEIWIKLWGNMTMNPLSVLARAETGPMLDDPDVRALIAAMMREMQALGEKIGLPIAMTVEGRLEITRRLGSFKTSMLRDAEAGRPLEIAPLLGVLAEIADRIGEPVPNIRSVLGLMRLHARNLTD